LEERINFNQAMHQKITRQMNKGGAGEKTNVSKNARQKKFGQRPIVQSREVK